MDSSRTSGSDWRFTAHARRRAAERGVTESELLAVLARPQVTYSQNSHGPGRQVCQRGELGVVVHSASRAVITVVFRDPARWMRHLGCGGAA